jgi:hypothetical protein
MGNARGQAMINEADAAEDVARQSREQHAQKTASTAAASQRVQVGLKKVKRTHDKGLELIHGLESATTKLKQTLPSGGGEIKDLKKNYTDAMEAAKNFTIFHQQTHPTALQPQQRIPNFSTDLDHHGLHMVLDPAKNERANQALGNFISAQEEAESLKYTSKKQGKPNKLKRIVKKPTDHEAITGWIKSQHIPTVKAGDQIVRAPMVQVSSKQGGRKTRKRRRRRKRKTKKHRKKKRTRRRKPKKRHRRTRRR